MQQHHLTNVIIQGGGGELLSAHVCLRGCALGLRRCVRFDGRQLLLNGLFGRSIPPPQLRVFDAPRTFEHQVIVRGRLSHVSASSKFFRLPRL